jgi:hypothetical protein
MDNPPPGTTPAWTDGLTDCQLGCAADYTTMGTNASPLLAYIDTDRLKINSKGGSGFYNYTSGTNTRFQRKITITPVVDVDGDRSNIHILKVVVEVSWDKKATIINPNRVLAGQCIASNNNCVTAEETLYDWY